MLLCETFKTHMPEAVNDASILELTPKEPILNFGVTTGIVRNDHASTRMRHNALTGRFTIENSAFENVVTRHPKVCWRSTELIDEKNPAMAPSQGCGSIHPMGIPVNHAPMSQEFTAIHTGACHHRNNRNVQARTELQNGGGFTTSRWPRYIQGLVTSCTPPKGELAEGFGGEVVMRI